MKAKRTGSDFVAFEFAVADLFGRANGTKVLALESGVFPSRSNVFYGDTFSRERSERERRTKDLPSTFTVRTIYFEIRRQRWLFLGVSKNKKKIQVRECIFIDRFFFSQ